jgi:DnaK suppressor protein
VIAIGVKSRTTSNGKLLEQGGADRGAVAGQLQDVAVGRRARHRLGGDDPAGSRAVVDDELLAEFEGQALGDDARRGIGDAARAVGNDDADGAVRIARLGAAGAGGGAHGGNGDQLRRSPQEGAAVDPAMPPLRSLHHFNPVTLLVVMLGEALAQYQRRRAGATRWQHPIAPGRRRITAIALRHGVAAGAPLAAVLPNSTCQWRRKCPIYSHLSQFRGPVPLMARSRLKGPNGKDITPPAELRPRRNETTWEWECAWMRADKLKAYRPSEKEPFMNERQREYFRLKLLTWKDDILKEAKETLQHLQDENQNHPDLADRASSETDRAIELRARDRQRKLIAKIDAALGRIEDGTYGYCEETGEPIAIKRLEARPIATLSIEAQERHERRERVYRDE